MWHANHENNRLAPAMAAPDMYRLLCIISYRGECHARGKEMINSVLAGIRVRALYARRYITGTWKQNGWRGSSWRHRSRRCVAL